MPIGQTAPRATLQFCPAGTPVKVGLALALGWVFWPTLLATAERWGSDSRYTHGYLVPLFAGYLLWSRRGHLPARSQPGRWGLAVLAAGLLLRFAGTYLYFDWLATVALLPCLAGLALLGGGWAALRWSWPAIAFLLFMVPLPFRVEVALAHPLQRVATLVSTYALQTLGFVAASEGNTIRMGEVRLGVVEACSGLSMLMIFFALSAAVATVVRRPLYEKALIVASAIPVALVANITRITVTGVLHKTVGSRVADLVFHDLAGWLMMPLALALLWAEMRLLAWVVIDAPAAGAGTATLPRYTNSPAARRPAPAPVPTAPAAG
jgi:exosortase